MVGWREWILGGALVAVVAGAFFGWGLGDYPLWDVEEARHAQVAREMTRGTGLTRFLLPTFASEPYRAKAPGYFWLVAGAFEAGGTTAGAARAINACAAILTVIVLYVFAARRDGPAAGLGAAFVTASCIGFVGLARYANVDMVLTACVSFGVLAGLAWLEAPSPRRVLRGPYLAMGIAVLLKGPIGILLIAGPLLLATVLQGALWTWRELGLVRGVVTIVGVVGLPALAIATLDPAYGYGLVTSHLRDALAGPTHPAPVYYHALWFPLLTMPWTLLAIPVVWRAVRTTRQWPLLGWMGFVLVLFSLPSGKLATDLLPALVPFGLLVGPPLAQAMDDEEDEDDRWLRVAGWAHVALLAVVAIAAAVVGVGSAGIGPALVVIAAAGWWMALTAVALGRDLPGAIPPLVLASVLTGVPAVIALVGPVVSAQHSDADAADLARRMAVSTVIAFRSQSPSLVFYSPVPVVHIEDPGKVRALFAGEHPVMLVTGARHMMEVERALGPLAHRWLDRGRRQTYGNRPLPPE